MKKEILTKINNGENLEEYFATLQGSEKQIAWATKIRKEFIENAIEEIEDAVDAEELEECLNDLMDTLNETDASEFIAAYTN